MVEKNKVYKFKEEFCKELKIPANQYDRKQQELLDWLTNFFDFEFYEGKPLRIFIKEIYAEYISLPRKIPNQNKLTKQKQEDIKNFVVNDYLSEEWKLASKCDAARQYNKKEGKQKYGWTNEKYIAQTYMKPVFNEYAENDGQLVWAWFSTYKPLDQLAYDKWVKIREEEKIGEKEAANGFYKIAQGENAEEELSAFQKALERFKKEYGDTPVLLDSWRLKTASVQFNQENWNKFKSED